jgi:small conductance mechanosensitive channel
MKNKQTQMQSQQSAAQASLDKQGKLNVPALIVLCLLLAGTVAIFVLTDKIFAADSFFLRGVSNQAFVNRLLSWVPPLLRTVQIVAISWALLWALRAILNKTLARSNRGVTIVKLTNNFLKYLVAIIALFLTLSVWGVNTATLLASAGILSLIIGLGAQSLISDILAGVFIVFEDEFRVGDIVIIDGWRGTVDEIGIRATKIIDWQGNVKIVNNSEIASIINQSKELSVTTCFVSIGYNESIPRVELIIKNNIERIRDAIPQIVDGPYYKGVDKLNASSVDLLLIATVKESDYFIVQRALNREIKMIFDENDVNIPFPQVTVSYADDTSSTVTAKEARQADQFALEQREASKQLEDTN